MNLFFCDFRQDKFKSYHPVNIAFFLFTAVRTATRTTNFIVIVLGAGFSGLLVYALASELFAKNSPTVLYNEICERIKTSPVVRRIAGKLILKFHRIHR